MCIIYPLSLSLSPLSVSLSVSLYLSLSLCLSLSPVPPSSSSFPRDWRSAEQSQSCSKSPQTPRQKDQTEARQRGEVWVSPAEMSPQPWGGRRGLRQYLDERLQVAIEQLNIKERSGPGPSQASMGPEGVGEGPGTWRTRLSFAPVENTPCTLVLTFRRDVDACLC